MLSGRIARITHPSHGDLNDQFYMREWVFPSHFHFLILLAGDVEQISCPKYPCPVCRRAYLGRRGEVQITLCK